MKKNIQNFIERGVIMGESSPTTFISGTIPYEVRNQSGDWTPYLVKSEVQFNSETDFMDCVTRSATNSIEIQEKFLTDIENNYCEREVALGSGTTPQGNHLDKVAEYIRKTGLGQATTYPDSTGDWAEQYQVIPADIQSKLTVEKQDWLTKWDIKYEVIGFDKKSLQYNLKQAPLQVVIPGHAIVDIFSDNDIERIFDSYSPFVKEIPPAYAPIIYAMKIVLYKKEQALDPDTLLIDLKSGDSGGQVVHLRNALRRLGWKNSDNNNYDFELSQVVSNYKLANLNYNYWGRLWERFFFKGKTVDETTRNNINNNIKISKR